jgi:glyoxylase-like metal-dependent hydrolase (beta-lactamase superfamily II)
MTRGTAEIVAGAGAGEPVTLPMVAAASAQAAGRVPTVDITGTAQHEAWQERTLPPVERLRADLWSIPVPIPHNPLRYVSVHAFALDGGGLGLLDTGWESDEGWTALTQGLASIGGGMDDVRGVLVTHLHFDHLGLAHRVREATGAWIAMHPADATLVAGWNARDGASAVAAEIEFLVGLGADRAEAVSDVGPAENMERFTRMAVPDRLLEDGEVADLPGWRMRAVHTPGHTPGHLCFAEERTGLFFSGDHVLPRITPNISTGVSGAADPLRDFLDSLAAVRDLDPVEVLPAHEWRFRGLAERVDALTAHHEQRLTELLTAVRQHPHTTPWQLAAHLTWSRPWDQYERRMRIFAVTETDAHLQLLASRGLVIGSREPVPTWTLAAR